MRLIRWILVLAAGVCLAGEASGQAELDAAVASFARAWRASDADAVAAAIQPEGIRLVLLSESHPMLAGRQARAALADFLASRAPGRLEAHRSGELGGSPARGSAEFRWQTVVHGTSEPAMHTIFVGFMLSGNGWRISEIRVF